MLDEKAESLYRLMSKTAVYFAGCGPRQTVADVHTGKIWTVPADRRKMQMQVDNSNFALSEGSSPSSCFILSGRHVGTFYVCNSSYRYFLYSAIKKRKLADILRMDAVALSTFLVYIGHGYLQQAEAEYFGYGNQSHHSGLFLRVWLYKLGLFAYS